MSTQSAKPVVVFSRCLGFEACRHDGQIARAGFAERLTQHVQTRTVCPELAIGLGVPRDPIRLVAVGDERRLVQPSTGRDLTGEMEGYAQEFVRSEGGAVDGFVMKTRSPSCGLTDAKTYAAEGSSPVLSKGAGMFTQAILSGLPRTMVIDEGRLSNAAWRHHFLSGIHLLAEWRQVEGTRTMGALVAFQTRHKFLLLSISEPQMRELGTVVANHARLPLDDVLARYGAGLAAALATGPSARSHRNVLQHCFGFVSDQLSAGEREHFLQLLTDLGEGRTTVPAILPLLKSWVVRFQVAYLAGQSYFEPYPAALVDLHDSGQSRAID